MHLFEINNYISTSPFNIKGVEEDNYVANEKRG